MDTSENSFSAAQAEPPQIASHTSTTDSCFWLRRSDQWFVGVTAGCALILLSLTWVRMSGFGRPGIEIDRLPSQKYVYQLDINHATWIEWTLLEGIGEKLARRIVAYRDEHGHFANVADLGNVPGIGPKTLEKLAPYLAMTHTRPE